MDESLQFSNRHSCLISSFTCAQSVPALLRPQESVSQCRQNEGPFPFADQWFAVAPHQGLDLSQLS